MDHNMLRHMLIQPKPSYYKHGGDREAFTKSLLSKSLITRMKYPFQTSMSLPPALRLRRHPSAAALLRLRCRQEEVVPLNGVKILQPYPLPG
jgi:hypothetical protein